MGNYEQALAAKIERLTAALKKIATVPGRDPDRLKRIAQEALEAEQ